ncbi:MAG TPA: TonB-dependent receptor [Thermoanaerobaculia bacterium]|nr:TonB-dependent receptor [Thermoanaerobaculia bacterium]HUM30532.1 TonB-dependent receptor [Thermoanaerobaculia bacterium]HXK68724.1 TonB-dependent receptor [Thermoanaerobaculia bacterium]
MSSFWSKASLLVLGVLLIAGLALAQTTGSIQGNVVDNGGQPLPGVTVEIESPNMQGTRVAQTDVNGTFRFKLVPPGLYTLTASMEGFATLKQADIQVGLDRTVTLQVTMQAAFEETVTVTGEAPVIDVTTTTAGANLTQEVIQDLPTGRSYQDLAFLASGALYGELGSNPSFGGASSAENRYLVDGMDTSDPTFGTIGTNVTFNFVQEVEVKTGGYEAEYGGAMGGIVNVVTKSGSNELHGEVFGYFTDDSMTSEGDEPVGGSALEGFKDYDYGADVGGKIIEDKLWYFVAYNEVYYEETNRLPGEGAGSFTEKREGDPGYYALKLNYQITPSNSVSLNLIGDPKTGNDFYGDYFIDVSDRSDYDMANPMDPGAPIVTNFNRTREEGGDNYGLSWNSILTPDLLFEFKANHTETKVDRLPMLDQATWVDWSGMWTCYGSHTDYGVNCGNGISFGGAGFAEYDTSRNRDQYKGAISYFIGDHEFKIGLSFSSLEFTDYAGVNGSIGEHCVPIGDARAAAAYDYFGDEDGDGVENYLDPDFSWTALSMAEYADITGLQCDFNGDGVADDGLLMPARDGQRFYLYDPGYIYYMDYYDRNYQQNSHGNTDEMAVFLQDAWKVTPNFTLKLGVRMDSSESTGDVSSATGTNLDFGLGDMVSPRIGFIWDFMNNGRSKAYGHYGKFYNAVPLQINVRAFGNENYMFYYYQYPTDENGDYELPSATNPGLLQRYRLSGGPATIVDGIKPMYEEEIILGGDYEVMPNWALGIKGIYRSIGDVMEDFSFDGGSTYIIGNPGVGDLGSACITVSNDLAGSSYEEREFCIPKASRIYRAVELSLKKRFSDNWQLYTSVLWSRNKGNYGGLFRQDNGQLDPFITSLFDLPQLMNGTNGLMPNDRTWQFKAYGSYRFDFGLVTGFDARWMSGTPLSKLGSHIDYGDDERFIGKRGDYGRTDPLYFINLHLSYPVKLSDRVDLKLIADIFNVFDWQQPLVAEQTWDSIALQWTDTTGLWDINDDGIADGFEDNPQGCDLPEGDPGRSGYCDYLNPTWGQTLLFQDPQSFRIGFILSW